MPAHHLLPTEILTVLSQRLVATSQSGDKHAPALGSGKGIREALGTGRPALDEYRGRRLLPNMVGPYPTDHKPLMDVWQHLGQFAHTSRTYHDHTGVLQ